MSDFRHPGVGNPPAQLLARLLGDLAIARLDAVELLVLELLEVEQHVVPALREPDQLVELHLDRLRIAVLGVLDQEHHQESHDGGAGVDDQLPRIAEAEDRAGDAPQRDHQDGDGEGEGPAARTRRPLGKAGEPCLMRLQHGPRTAI